MRSLTVVVLVMLSLTVNAQDLIILFPHDSIEVKILRVEEEKVQFLGDVGTEKEEVYTLHKNDIKQYIVGYFSGTTSTIIDEPTFFNPIGSVNEEYMDSISTWPVHTSFIQKILT
jgi:hypothetical protein